MEYEEKTFEFPQQPDDLIKVKDRNGNVWRFDGKWWRSEAAYYGKVWFHLLHELGPLTQLEYKQSPPNEYELAREVLGALDSSWNKFSNDAVADLAPEPVQAAKEFIDRIKKYYGIIEE